MIPMFAAILLALLQANISTATRPPAGQEQARTIKNPTWIRRPDGDDMAAAYPAAAATHLKNGRGILVCTVNDQGRLTDCDVTGESPTGWGFGKAILSLAGKFRMRTLDRDGSPVAGSRVSIPVALRVSGGS
jgi:protein TonB